jgi:hypothetical protein
LQQLFYRLPARERQARVIEHALALARDKCLLDADQPVGLLHRVERDPRHAKRVAAHVRRKIDRAVPLPVAQKKILSAGHPEHRDRQESLALAGRDERERVIAARHGEFGIRDRHGVDLAAEFRKRSGSGSRTFWFL